MIAEADRGNVVLVVAARTRRRTIAGADGREIFAGRTAATTALGPGPTPIATFAAPFLARRPALGGAFLARRPGLGRALLAGRPSLGRLVATGTMRPLALGLAATLATTAAATAIAAALGPFGALATTVARRMLARR